MVKVHLFATYNGRFYSYVGDTPHANIEGCNQGLKHMGFKEFHMDPCDLPKPKPVRRQVWLDMFELKGGTPFVITSPTPELAEKARNDLKGRYIHMKTIIEEYLE